jgi:hypothetical protein
LITAPHYEKTPSPLANGLSCFTWHQDDIAKRLGPHQENALADVNLKKLRMRAAKLSFRLKHLLKGGLIPPFRIYFELFKTKSSAETKLVLFPRLGL